LEYGVERQAGQQQQYNMALEYGVERQAGQQQQYNMALEHQVAYSYGYRHTDLNAYCLIFFYVRIIPRNFLNFRL